MFRPDNGQNGLAKPHRTAEQTKPAQRPEGQRTEPDTSDSPSQVELGGRTFRAAPGPSLPEWPCVTMRPQQATLTLKDNDLFLITDTLGNINGCLEEQLNAGLGFFCRDTRFLSRLELQVERQLPVLLSSTAQQGFALSALCANPYIPAGEGGQSAIPAETVGIQRDLVLQGGLFEDIRVTHYGTQPITFELSLSFAADFADLFEIRGMARAQNGTLFRQVLGELEAQDTVPAPAPEALTAGGSAIAAPESPESPESHGPPPAALQPPPQASLTELNLAYRGLDGVFLESRIQFYQRHPDRFEGNTAIWSITLQPHQSETICYRLQPWVADEPASAVGFPATLAQAIASETMEIQQWRDRVTQIHTDNRALNQIIDRAQQDLYLLTQRFGDLQTFSAGIPWFSTLFGRDSIIAAQQTLMLNPAIARQTLSLLAHYQGQVRDDWREEEPGKILHELRRGEMARCNEIPHQPYYGSVDATPLWLMLLLDYHRWTGDDKLLEQLWPNVLAAMDWIDRNCEATGYLTYERRSERGLRNQGWKDSGDCMVDASGQLAQGAIALAEVQGYVYAAKQGLAELALLRQQPELAQRWRQQAEAIKARFQRDFWLPQQGYVALALDGNARPLDSITSNPGHCLGLGLLSPGQSESVAERLQAPDMFSGWGIRTLSSDSPAYNPMGYHIGSVWPHDNSLIALGLRKLGRTEQVLEIAQAILDMTAEQPYARPPELFCGFERRPEAQPIRYPVACSPQAWASGSIFQLLQTMVNLVPDAGRNQLRIVHPALPDSVERLSLKNLKVGQTILDLDFERVQGATSCRVARKRGNLRLVIEA